MSTTAFSSGDDAISRTIQIDSTHRRTAADFDTFYEIERTADEILAGDFKRIALQFPDELLGDSVPVFRALNSRVGTGREIYVLADTSYGSCCVDEVAAQHVDADAVVHYGYACLSQTSRLPVIYVFGEKFIDLGHALSSFLELLDSVSPPDATFTQSILLKGDVIYSHSMGELVELARDALRSRNTTMTYSPPLKTVPQPNSSEVNAAPAESISSVLYIGGESLALTNLLMTNAQSQVISYDPETKTAKIESSRTNRMLMRRYAVVQRAKDADVFGILVGTLGVASYLPLIKHLRSLLARNQKKSYTISVGKLNAAKLANFMEIECFVLVACPENSLIDAKEFYQSIVTPFELEIALGAGRSWTGEYVLDFDQILNESKIGKSAPEERSAVSEEEDADRPVFSLVTGKYRQAKRYGELPANVAEDAEGQANSLVVRNRDDSLVALPNSAALQFLHQRTYQGLEVGQGGDKPSVLEQGRSGIARGYQTDISKPSE